MHNLLFRRKSVHIVHDVKVRLRKTVWDYRSAVWFRGGQGNGNAVSRRRCQLHGNYYKSYLFRSLWKLVCFPFALFSCLWIWKTDGHLLGRGRARVDCGRWASSSTGLSVQWHHRFRLQNKSMFVSIRQESQRAPNPDHVVRIFDTSTTKTERAEQACALSYNLTTLEFCT